MVLLVSLDGRDIFVTAPRQGDHDEIIGFELAGHFLQQRQGMGAFDRRDDAFQAGQPGKGVDSLAVGHGGILRAA